MNTELKHKRYTQVLLKRYYRLGIILFILNLVLSTGFIIVNFNASVEQAYILVPLTNKIVLFITGLALILIPFLTFKDVYKLSALDIYFALPEKEEKVFVHRALFSYLLVVIPGAIVFIINNLFLFKNMQGSLDNEYLEPKTSFIILLMLIFAGFILMQPSLIAILSSTSLANAFISTILIHLLPVFTRLIYEDYFQGFPGQGELIVNNEVYIFENFYQPLENYIAYATALYNQGKKAALMQAGLILFILALILFFLSIYLYKTYRPERIASNYQVKYFSKSLIFITLTLALIIPFSLLLRKALSWFKLIIIIALVFIAFYVLNVLRLHKKPKVLKTIFNYLLSLVLAFAIAFIFSYKLPIRKAKEIVDIYEVQELVLFSSIGAEEMQKVYEDEKLQAEFSYKDYPEQVFFNKVGYYPYYKVHEYKDKTKIQALERAQKHLIQSEIKKTYKEPELIYETEYGLKFIYKGAEGELLQVRDYALTREEMLQLSKNFNINFSIYPLERGD